MDGQHAALTTKTQVKQKRRKSMFATRATETPPKRIRGKLRTTAQHIYIYRKRQKNNGYSKRR